MSPDLGRMPPHCGIAFVLIDGLGDVSIPELGNRTPLEAAHTPFLDALAGLDRCRCCCPGMHLGLIWHGHAQLPCYSLFWV